MAGDALYNNVSLLLHCDGSNGSTTFTDNSPTPKTVTANGGAQISTAQSKFGGSSMYLTGAGSYLSTPSVPDLLFGSGDFTAEAWVRPSAISSSQKIVGVWSDTTGTGFSWKLGILGTGYLYFSYSTTGGNGFSVSATSQQISANAWSHVAAVRSGTTIYLFVDGVLAGSATGVSATFFGTSASKLLEIGRDGAGTTEYFNGYIDDLRITKSVARYTGNFTPPAAAFGDRLPQVSGNVKDASGANAARTVRAYRRDTGALVGSATSNGTTGNYTIDCATDVEVTVIAFDNATSGTYYNDQVARVIPA